MAMTFRKLFIVWSAPIWVLDRPGFLFVRILEQFRYNVYHPNPCTILSDWKNCSIFMNRNISNSEMLQAPFNLAAINLGA